MRHNGKRWFGILLSLVMALGMMAGMSLKAFADDPYVNLTNTTTTIHFDDKEWYLIDYDDSTATLLSKECVAASKYGLGNVYSGSVVEAAVNNHYGDSISAATEAACSAAAF